jgi:hypothetical protein
MSAVIEAQDSATFTITCPALTSGEKSGDIIFAHTAINASPFILHVDGTGVSAALNYSTHDLQFGTVSSSCQSSTIVVNNTGAGSLCNITTALDNPGFTIEPSVASIPAFGSATFTVTFTPFANGSQNAHVVFMPQLPDARTQPLGADTVSLSGSGDLSSVFLGTGWQMVSLPVQPSCSYLTPATFEYTTGYTHPASLQPGTGYWRKLPDPFFYFSGSPILEQPIALNARWNMIGSISEPVPVSAITSEPAELLSSPFFGYDGGYEAVDTIQPGHGYWVRASQQGQIVLKNSTSAPAPKSTARSVLSNASVITLIDANHRTQRLYLLMEKSPDLHVTDRFILPPVPPDGSFDVRFASGRMLEVAEEGRDFPLTISSAQYPLTLRWNITGSSMSASMIIDGTSLALSGAGATDIKQQPSNIRLRLSSASLVEKPKEFALYQNYPNPFNPSTTIRYSLPVESRVTLGVFNVLGKEVESLVNDELQGAGYKSVEWNAGNLPSGLYFYKLSAGRFVSVRKTIVLK